LTLDDAAGLQSDAIAPNLTDSQLETDLMEEWQVMLAIESGSPVATAPSAPLSLETSHSVSGESDRAVPLMQADENNRIENPTRQWQLEREGDILVRGQRVFFPDFTVISPSGFRVFLEIVGFWTPEYIRHKKEVLEVFALTPLLLAIPQSLKKQWQSHRFSPNHKVIYYQQSISPGEIIQAIEENNP
jgi:predicted nuclease of restriction endonuclease-like RecB superfamily